MPKRQRERRRHKRHELACPLSVSEQGGGVLANSRSINISDGGMLFPVPADARPKRGASVRVEFSVPRATPNTFLLEGFSAEATVVRHEPAGGDTPARVALAFQGPVDLALEV
jgi:hypothetical protein